MKSDVVIKFENSDGNLLEVGAGKEWSFQRGKGLSDFSSFNGEITATENYMRDGAITKKIRLNAKDRTINLVHIYPEDAEKSRVLFKQYFRYGEKYKMYITYMGHQLWQECILYKMQLSEDTQIDNLMKATMTFRFDSPYWLSVDNFGKNIASVIGRFGFPWYVEKKKPIPVGYFEFDKNTHLLNDGDNISYPKVYIKTKGSTVKNPTIHLNDGFVRLNRDLKATEELIMDFSATPPTIRINGNNVFGYCDRLSNFDEMYLKKGDNVVSFAATSGSDELEIYIEFYKMYTVV